MRNIARALAVASVLAGLAVAQAPPWARATGPDAIAAAYGADPRFKAIRHERVDRLPFVFFVEDRERLGQVLEIEAFAGARLLREFEKRFAKAIGRERNGRVFPVWLLARPRSFASVRGTAVEAAHFDPVSRHVVALFAGVDRSPAHLQVVHRATVRAIVASYGDATSGNVSDWLSWGLGEHLASRPGTSFLTNRDPEFAFVDQRRLDKLDGYVKRRVRWDRKKISFLHHPLDVTKFETLDAYLDAAGAKGSERAEQVLLYRDSCYAIVTFLQNAFRGHFKGKLSELLKREYGGTHGLEAMRAAFTQAELDALPQYMRSYVSAAKDVADMELSAPVEEAFARASVKKGLYGGATPPKSSAKTAGTPPPGVVLARAAAALLARDFATVQELLDERDDAAAERLVAAAGQLDELTRAWAAKAAGRGSKVTLFLPVEQRGRVRNVSHRVLSHDPEDGTIEVQAKGGTRSVALADVPAHLFGESLRKQRLLGSKERKDALGLLVALACRAIGDAKERTKTEKRAARYGLLGDCAFLRAGEAVIAAEQAMARARSELGEPTAVTPALRRLVKTLRPLRSADVRWLVDAELPGLLAAAWAVTEERLPALAGKVTQLAGGRVRVEYDWSDPKQQSDWVALDPTKEGLAVAESRRWDVSRTKVEVDTSEQRLLIRGQAALMHRLQLVGDFKLAAVYGTRFVEVDGERRLRSLGPPLFLMHARRRNTHLRCTPFHLVAIRDGTGRAQATADRDDVAEIFVEIQEGRPVVYERKGDELALLAGDEKLLDLNVKKVAPEGAVMMVQPVRQKAGDEPNGVVGPIVIEGTPHPASTAAGWPRFRDRWLREASVR